MANKTGFAYYNLDTDRYQDIRIKRLKREFGAVGLALYDYIISELYRLRGCYVEWDESMLFEVADYFQLEESVVMDVVNYCCFVGLFDAPMLAQQGVLTSASIQRRYVEMCRRAKRTNIIIPEKIAIIEMEQAELPEKEQKTPAVARKVEKRRVDKSKAEESMCVESADTLTPTDPQFLEFQEFINLHTPRVAQMQEPFREHEFRWLKERYFQRGNAAFVKMILSQMHNSSNLLSRNVNAYITFGKFASRSPQR